MKAAAVMRFKFTIDYWRPVFTTDPGGGSETITHELDASGIKCMAIPSGGGGVAILTKEPMEIGGIIRNLVDRKGNAVFSVNGTPYDMYINTSEPQFSPFSDIIGWRHALIRTMPKSLDSTIDKYINGLINGTVN